MEMLQPPEEAVTIGVKIDHNEAAAARSDRSYEDDRAPCGSEGSCSGAVSELPSGTAGFHMHHVAIQRTHVAGTRVSSSVFEAKIKSI